MSSVFEKQIEPCSWLFAKHGILVRWFLIANVTNCVIDLERFIAVVIVLGWVFLSFSALSSCPSLIFWFRCQNSVTGATCGGLQAGGHSQGQGPSAVLSIPVFLRVLWDLPVTANCNFLSQRVSQIVKH